jgi:hypothetical protein
MSEAEDRTPAKQADAGLDNGSAGTANANQSRKVLHLVGHRTSATSLDLGPAGGNPGDEVIFSGQLLDTGGHQVGRFEGVLTALDNEGNRNQAQVTLVLPAGQIAVQGEVDFTAPDPVVHAITGGTGSYAGARGTFSLRHTDQPGVIAVTLDFIG